MRKGNRIFSFSVLGCLVASHLTATYAQSRRKEVYRPDRVLVIPKSGAQSALQDFHHRRAHPDTGTSLSGPKFFPMTIPTSFIHGAEAAKTRFGPELSRALETALTLST